MKVPSIFRSITFKLWLSLVCALLLTLSIAFVVSYSTTQKRFISFSFNLLKERLAPLEREILSVYTRDKSLDAFKTNPDAWPRAVRRTIKFTRNIKIEPPHSGFEPPPPPPGTSNKRSLKPNYTNKHLHEAQKRFFRTLSLHDAEKRSIAQYKIEPRTIYWHPVRQGDKLIAYISFEKPTYVLKKNEAIFLQKLLLFFTQIAVVMLIVSTITAAIISRWLLSPVTKISAGARNVQAGDLSTRIHYKSSDEIGELCRNFNDMCAKLESNEVARRKWVADISHEMRTPVAVLKAQIEAMLDGIRPIDHKNIKLLDNKIESLSQLINDLYELALSDTGDLKIHKTRVDILKLVRDFIEENRTRASAQNIDLSFDSELTEPECIQIDALKISQILHNLFNNSLSYTDSPGQIQWRLISTSTEIILEAEDSAPGTSESEVQKIFERLYRVEQSRNRVTGGAGLGLALSLNIAKAHGGDLSASQSVLGGLKLKLRLPKGT